MHYTKKNKGLMMSKEAISHLESALRISELIKNRVNFEKMPDIQIISQAMIMIEKELELARETSCK